MKKDAVRELQVIEGFLREWDPLDVMTGVRNDGILDEYASYAPSIHGMLRRECSAEDLAAHLREIESESMGIVPTPERDLAVAEKIVNWWKSED